MTEDFTASVRFSKNEIMQNDVNNSCQIIENKRTILFAIQDTITKK